MYIDAIQIGEEIKVVERVNGERVYQEFPAEYYFFEEAASGEYKSIFRTECRKIECADKKSFTKELSVSRGKKKRIFESDIRPLNKCLEKNYKGQSFPELHIGLFDIEVDFDLEKGFAPPTDTFNPVTAISIYLNWLDTNITLTIPPCVAHPQRENNKSFEYYQSKINDIDNCIMFDNEAAMLAAFLDLIEDVDVLSGWNSTTFDIPYLINRITEVLGKDYTKQFCLWEQFPKKRIFTKFGKENTTFDLIGKVHLDYLDLYQKNTFGELHSYRLDYVGEIEVGANKVPYEGTLDDLYCKDYRKFIEYSIQDVEILVQLDKKLGFIQLANQLAHTNTVSLPTTMGSVALIEQAIINEAHDLGMVVPDKPKSASRGIILDDEDDEESDEEGSVAGAFVADPKTGLHNWVGAIDINSLYPSLIRTLNMGPETLIGQLRSTRTEDHIKELMSQGKTATEAWAGMFGTIEYSMVMDKSQEKIIIDWPDGNTDELTGEEIYKLVFDDDKNICLSANGTFFSTEQQGIIPHLLERWYSERKQMQKKAWQCEQMLDGVELPSEMMKKLEEALK